MRFYVGCHHVSKASHFDRCMLSHNTLRGRKSGFEVSEWILDSGAFTQIEKHGAFQVGVEEYARDVERWSACGNMRAAVSQDYMCEPHILERCDATVEQHQRKTVRRYDEIQSFLADDITLMPVLQGWSAEDYQRHVMMYGSRLEEGQWTGVGSVCKRNGSPADVEWVLSSILEARSDLRLHGFGIKTTALRRPQIRGMLYSADSMAWRYRARREGRDQNSVKEAKRFVQEVTEPSTGTPLFDRNE